VLNMNNLFRVNLIMAVVLVLIFLNLARARRSGEIWVGFAKYIRNGSPEMKRWFVGGVIINIIWAIAIIVAFFAQLLRFY